MHSFRTVFLLFKKILFSPGGRGHRGQSFGKRWLSYFQYISSENRRTFVPVASVKQRGVKSETRSAYLTKEKLLWGISSERERERPASPQQMGALSLWPEGDRAKERRETTIKVGDTAGLWHMSHRGGGFYSAWLWCVIMLPVLSWASTLSACAALFCTASGQGNKRE